MKPDLDDVARVLIAAGYAPYDKRRPKAGGFGIMERPGLNSASVWHETDELSPYHPLIEDDMRVIQYARALKARGYLVTPDPVRVADERLGERLEHRLIVRLKD